MINASLCHLTRTQGEKSPNLTRSTTSKSLKNPSRMSPSPFIPCSVRSRFTEVLRAATGRGRQKEARGCFLALLLATEQPPKAENVSGTGGSCSPLNPRVNQLLWKNQSSLGGWGAAAPFPLLSVGFPTEEQTRICAQRESSGRSNPGYSPWRSRRHSYRTVCGLQFPFVRDSSPSLAPARPEAPLIMTSRPNSRRDARAL